MSMTELEIEEHGWDREEWTLPPVMPREVDGITTVGVPLSYYSTVYDFKDAWFTYDPLNWEIKPFRRRELYNMIKRRFDLWKEWLPYDSTRTFHQTISGLKKHSDGGIIGLAGPKGSSKSVGGSMMTERVVSRDDFAHVIFKYADIEKKTIGREDIAIVIQVDEDTKATGNESKNLVIHVNNAFETSRKAELWAICTGVNLNFNGWGDTLDLRLIPFGFNRTYQATRFAAFDRNMDLIGLIVLQRKHLSTRPVYFYEDLGTWATYKARARAFSISVSRKGGVIEAVDAPTQTKHIEEFKLWLTKHRLGKGLEIPKEVMCRRLYRKAKLPSKSVGYMKEVILWAKAELEDTEDTDSGSEPIPEMTAEGWEGLRESLENLTKDPAFALYSVPKWPKMSYAEVGAELNETVLPDSLGKRIRNVRRRLPPKSLGDAGEIWFASQLDSLGAVWGGGGEGSADVLLTIRGLEVAVNVKTSLSESLRKDEETTPENEWSHSLVALVLPRLLEIRLYPIQGVKTNINSRKGGLVAPVDLAHAIEEMIAQ